MGEGTNGDPLGLVQATWLRVTLPRPPGRMASVGPARPEDAKDQAVPHDRCRDDLVPVLPSHCHNSRPVSGA